MMNFDHSTDTIIPDNTNILTIGGTSGLELPTGTTAQRRGDSTPGCIRYNSTTDRIDILTIGQSWQTITTTGSTGSVGRMSAVTIGQLTGTTQMATSSAPTSTSGFQIATLTVTPTSINSKFVLECSAFVDFSTNNRNVVMAIFRGTTLVGTSVTNIATAGRVQSLNARLYDTPAQTAAITYTVRVGTDNSGTTYINRAIRYTVGSSSESAFVVTEIL